MINVIEMQKSFLLNWARKLTRPNNNDIEEKWKCIPIDELSVLGNNLTCFNSNIESKHFKGINLINNTFWK